MKTLVVPEGGELPPDEELAAMEAAEAARVAEELAAAQAASGQAAAPAAGAETAEVEYLEDEAPDADPGRGRRVRWRSSSLPKPWTQPAGRPGRPSEPAQHL